MVKWFQMHSVWTQEQTFIKFLKKMLRLSWRFRDIVCSAAFKTHRWIIFSHKLSVTPDKWAGNKRNTTWLADWSQEEYKEHSKPKQNRYKDLCSKTHIWEGNSHNKLKSRWQQSLRRVPPLIEVAVAVSHFITDHVVTRLMDGLGGCCWGQILNSEAAVGTSDHTFMHLFMAILESSNLSWIRTAAALPPLLYGGTVFVLGLLNGWILHLKDWFLKMWHTGAAVQMHVKRAQSKHFLNG